MRRYLLVATILLFLVACKKPQAPIFENVSNLKIIKADFITTSVSGEIRFTNPNSMGFHLKKADCELKVNGTVVGNFKNDTGLKIPAGKSFTVPVVGEISTIQLAKMAMGLSSDAKIAIELTGNASIAKSSFKRVFPISFRDTVAVNQFLPK